METMHSLTSVTYVFDAWQKLININIYDFIFDIFSLRTASVTYALYDRR